MEGLPSPTFIGVMANFQSPANLPPPLRATSPKGGKENLSLASEGARMAGLDGSNFPIEWWTALLDGMDNDTLRIYIT